MLWFLRFSLKYHSGKEMWNKAYSVIPTDVAPRLTPQADKIEPWEVFLINCGYRPAHPN